MNMIETIAPLVEAGFAVHWLHPRDKAPIGDDWQNRPVASIESLRHRYVDGNNVGVRLGEFSRVGGGYLHVIDVDIRHPKFAVAAWSALAKLLPGVDFTALPSVISGSGGESRHVYFITDHPFRSRKLARSDDFDMVFDGKLGREVKKRNWEIELFGSPKQVVMPPSIHPTTGQRYRWEREFDFFGLDFGIVPIIASSLIEAAGASLDEDDAEPANDERLGLSLDEAREILDALPVDVWCEDRGGWRDVGMALKHEFGDGGFDLWCDFSKQSAKYDEREQRSQWKSFKGKAKRLIRMATLKRAAADVRLLEELDDLDVNHEDILGSVNADIDLADALSALSAGLDDDDNDGDIPGWVEKLNKKHAVAFVEGKTVILSQKYDGSTAYGSVTDLHNFYENVRRETQKSSEPITKAWMRHKGRASYPNGIVFAPNGGPKGAFNHWRGFSVEPDPSKSCDLFLSHLRDVICCGNDEAYQWLVRWFAHMIQKPEEKPGTAVVLKGRKGTGKDTVAEYVGGLFPRHHTKIANAEHLYGKFNAHQEKTLLLHVEEGFWAGDKKAEGSLKYVITSEQVQIEPKGVNAFQVPSVLRVFISSNEEWVVPASFDERRFFVMNVIGGKRESAYYSALRAEMKNGGRAALLHHLQTLSLRGFDVRNPPMTEGLRDQKLQSLRNIEKWWYETLVSGDLPGAGTESFDNPCAADWSETTLVGRTSLRSSYRDWMRDHRYDGVVLGEADFGRRLKEMVPDMGASRPRSGSGGRMRLYEIPPLRRCRETFEKVLGLSIDWQDDI